MRYALVFHAPELTPDGPQPSEEGIQEMMRLMDDYAAALNSAGVFVAWEMLAPHSETKTVTRRTGEVVIEDGPFAAAKGPSSMTTSPVRRVTVFVSEWGASISQATKTPAELSAAA